MVNKIRSRIKYYSCVIFPIITSILCIPLSKKTDIFELDDTKITALISVSATFIGALLTILTIYLAVPKSPQKMQRFKETHHESIYLSNIAVGIIIYMLSMLSWLFFDCTLVSTILFIAGLSNILASIYYTFSTIKYM